MNAEAPAETLISSSRTAPYRERLHGTFHMAMTGPDGSSMEDMDKFIEIRRKVGDR